MKDYTLEKRKYVIGAAAIVIVLIYVFRPHRHIPG